MDKIQSMQVFIKVAELSSFTKAAESLGMPKASVSTYIQALEAQVSVRLFHRTTRSVQLTQDGMIFLERCKDLIVDIQEAESMFQVSSQSLSGRIRVDMSTRMARNVVLPRLNEFLELHPKIEIELSSTDRKVDLIQEGFDCVVRIGKLSDSELIARPLGEFKIINCVSPGYIKKYGKPKSLKELSHHRMVHYVSTLGSKSSGFEYFEDGKYKTMKMAGSVTVNNAEAYLTACLEGFGIIQVPESGVRENIRSGELMEVLAKLKSEPMPISLIYPHRRYLSSRVQAFMDWVEKIVKEDLKA